MARPRAPSRVSRAWLLCALLVVPVMLACSGGVTVIDTAPAREVHFSLNVSGMYSFNIGSMYSTPEDTPPVVSIGVVVSDPSGRQIALGSGQRLSCDGQTDPLEQHAWYSVRFTLPRRPPGQTYNCVYTDEHSVVTDLPIPVPSPALALTSPTAGSHVAIVPYGERIPIRYTFPAPPGYVPPLATTSATSVATAPGSPVASPTRTRGGPTATIVIEPGCGTDAPGELSECPMSVPPSAPPGASGEPPTGTYAMPVWGYLHPGPGYLIVSLTMQWSLLAAGFAGADIQTTDYLTVPITWTGSPSG